MEATIIKTVRNRKRKNHFYRFRRVWPHFRRSAGAGTKGVFFGWDALLNALDAPAGLLSAVEFEPAKARGSAFVGATERSRIEETSRTAKFIPGNVGVAVKEQIESFRRLWRRDVFEPNTHPFHFHVEPFRPVGTIVAIAQDDPDWRSDLLQGIDHRGRAYVPEVPDFVGPGDSGQYLGRQSIVSIGKDCDSHGKKLRIADCGLNYGRCASREFTASSARGSGWKASRDSRAARCDRPMQGYFRRSED
jgi:hypothetical protein